MRHGCRQALLEPDRDELIHGLVGRERGPDRHPGPARVGLHRDLDRQRRDLGVVELELEVARRLRESDATPAGLSIHVYESAGAPRYGIYER